MKFIIVPAVTVTLWAAAAEGVEVIPADGSELAGKAADELREWLTKVSVPEGIEVRIGLADDGAWPESVAPWVRRVGESEALEAHAVVVEPGERRVSLVCKSHRALDPAVFGLLYDLGFRWYLPGEQWQVVPESVDLLAGESRLVAPDFRRRTWFGTGGFGPRHLKPDPDLEVQAAWRDWQRRNRWGGEVIRIGHAGDDIIGRHAQVFEENPDFRAMADGERVPMDKQFHFSYGNPRFQEWYASERVDWLRRAIERDPDTLAVSTDPADGGHPHCESPESLALGDGSVSDRVFSLANVAARAVAKEFPDRWVGINAYNRHLAPPSIPLEPNLYVQVIPYAFNRTGMEAEELVEAWGAKHPGKLGIYDYWNITDWARCEPQMDVLERVTGRIPYWKESGFAGVALESSASIGAMGLPFIVASRMLWDVSESPEALLDEFFAAMFGPAEPPVRRMFGRWEEEFLLTPQEIALSYRDLDEAMRLAKGDPILESRLRDLIAYVFFLQRKLEFEEAHAEDPDDLEHALRFAEAIWQNHRSGMVQAYRMHQLIGYRYYRGRFDETIFAAWNPRDPDSPGWDRYEPLTEAEIDAILRDGIETHPVLYEPADFALDELVPFVVDGVSPPGWIEVPSRLGRSRFVFLQDGNARIELRNEGKRENDIRVTVRPYGLEVTGERIDIEPGEWTHIPVPSEAGLYEMTIRPFGALHHEIRATPSTLLTELGGSEVRQPRADLFFFVPRGAKKIALHTPAPAPTGLDIFDAGDHRLLSQGDFLRTVDVPEEQDGRIWRLRGHAGASDKQVKVLNGPRVTGFSPHGMLVPKAAVD